MEFTEFQGTDLVNSRLLIPGGIPEMCGQDTNGCGIVKELGGSG